MKFHDKLKVYIHSYIKIVYEVTNNFPKHEMYGITSQFRRAAVSVMLNYVEGFGRRRGNECKVYNNFLEIAYGSLKETKYLLYLSLDLKYINKEQYDKAIELSENIGAMLYSLIK